MIKRLLLTIGPLTLLFSQAAMAVAKNKIISAGTDGLDRTVLPIAEPKILPSKVLDVRHAKAPPRFEVKVPNDAPNALLVLLDDLGFAGTSSFGGPIATPSFERIANEGLRYNNFHTTAVCSPTRAALKSERNHHVNNMGAIIETGTTFPGNTGQIPRNVAPLAEMLRLNDYATAAFGKWHEAAAWEASMAGPFDRWPPRQGFDKFYGFQGGETNQWALFICDGTNPVEVLHDPNYHFMIDMSNQAIAWIKYQKALTPEKPFFTYFAPGAVHASHHVPKEWIAHWQGKFDQGLDKLREQILARQVENGTVPNGTVLAPRPETIPVWDSLTEEKRLFARQAEVDAGFVKMTDHEIGRLIKAIEEVGQLENTLVLFVYGDNGTSAESGRNGMFNAMTYFNGAQETVPDMLKHIDAWGRPETYPHMAAGWAVALDTPYQWTKQVGSDHGGTKLGMALRWPKGIKTKGEFHTQSHHVIDVAPTILETAGLPEPKVVNGVKQRPMDGVSMAYSFDDGKTKERHTSQYFMAGRTSLTLAEGMSGMTENVFLNIKNKSKTISADLEISQAGANGVIIAQGGRFGGWCLYLKDGKPAYTYNILGQENYTISAQEALATTEAV